MMAVKNLLTPGIIVDKQGEHVMFVMFATCLSATYLGLQITVDHIEAVQIGEREHYFGGVELRLVVRESADQNP